MDHSKFHIFMIFLAFLSFATSASVPEIKKPKTARHVATSQSLGETSRQAQIPPGLPPLDVFLENLPNRIRENFARFIQWMNDNGINLRFLRPPFVEQIEVPLFDFGDVIEDRWTRRMRVLLQIAPVIVYLTFIYWPAPFIWLWFILRLVYGVDGEQFFL